MPNPDELDLLDLRQLLAEEIHAWRKRQPKFCYPVPLAVEIGVAQAAALYFILSAIAAARPIISDSDVAAETGCCPADIAAARTYGQQCGILQATELAAGVWQYELQLVAFSEWAAQRRRQRK